MKLIFSRFIAAGVAIFCSVQIGWCVFPVPEIRGMAALSSTTIVLWIEEGKIRFVDSTHSHPILQMPLTYINDVVRDNGGALIAGVVNSEKNRQTAVALLIDDQGKILKKWTGSEEPFLTVSVHGEGKWAASWTGLYRLKLDGSVEKTEELRGHAVSRALLPSEEQKIICTSKNSSKQFFATADCRSVGRYKWSAEGRWFEIPFICGDYLVEQSRIESDECVREQIVLRSIKTGKVKSQSPLPIDSALTCSHEAGVIIAKQTVSEINLTDFKKRWEKDLGEEKAARVVDMGEQMAVLTKSNRVIFIKK